MEYENIKIELTLAEVNALFAVIEFIVMDSYEFAKESALLADVVYVADKIAQAFPPDTVVALNAAFAVENMKEKLNGPR